MARPIAILILALSVTGPWPAFAADHSLPADQARPAVEYLIAENHVRRGWLGVHIQAVTDEIAKSFGLDHARGALVATVVKNSPAAKAGLRAGDVILEFNGREVSQMRRLPRIVADTGVGKTVDVTLWRNNEKLSVRVTVGELEPSEEQVAAATEGPKKDESGSEKAIDALGMTLSVITDTLRQKFELGEETKGLVVTAIAEGGPASEKAISPGDVVVEVSQEDVTGPDQVDELVNSADKAGRKSVLLLIDGQGRLRFVAVRIAKS